MTIERTAVLIYAESGEDFQEYVYDDTNKQVLDGEPIGVEIGEELILLENIKYKN
jgi:hypothetical protein